jgi:hypothetical protein
MLGGMERRKRKRRAGRAGGTWVDDGTGSERTQNRSERSRTEPGPLAESEEEVDEYGIPMKYFEARDGWWTGYGFKSFGEYLRYSQTGPDRTFSFDAHRRRARIRAAKPPGGDPPPRGSAPTARSRQISIRLDEEGYEALSKAARMYGVAPATMGRLLVQRGARLALESG